MLVSVVHYGYTAKETARKDRRGRNIELLEAAHKASPHDPRYWHYLGIELRGAGELEAAAGWFDRVLAKAPTFDLAAWSASGLAAIHESEEDLGTAWALADSGARGGAGRVNCLVQMGAIAIREGDADTARWCADELDRNPTDDFTSRATGLEHASELRGAALVLTGSKKARDFLALAAKKYPHNTALAALLVKCCEDALGKGKGASEAMKRVAQAPVVAAAMNAAYTNGALAACAELGAKTKVASEMWTFALAKLGRLEEARDALLAFGERSAAHAVVFGLAYDDEAALAHAEPTLKKPETEALALVRAGTRVPTRLVPFLTAWLRLAVGLREDKAATMLTASLPWTKGEREAFRALSTFNAGEPNAALTRALEHPTELASMEVIGLVAHQHGDYAAAATMLSMRAKAGDASARVTLKGADALLRLGRKADATQLLALGREARPASRGILAFGKELPRHAGGAFPRVM